MEKKENKLKEKLAGRNIIIIEDDESLPKRLIKEFKRCGAKVTVKTTVDSGLAELNEHGSDYDLAIVDAMLPQSENAYSEIKKLKDGLREIQTTIENNDAGADAGDKKAEEEIAHAQEKRRRISAEIELLICKDGGIQMVKEWVKWLAGEDRCPILYFTALGDADLKTEGFEAAGNSHVEWLTKPVTVDNILNKAGELIETNSVR